MAGLELRELRIADERPPSSVPRGRSAPTVVQPTQPSSQDSEREPFLEKPKSFQPLTKVPMWFYDNLITVGWWPNEYVLTPIKITTAAFLWWANFVCFVAHSTFASVTVWASTRNGRTMATPLLTTYVTNLTWVADSTDALVPRFQKSGGLYLSWMVFFFFGLSAFFHFSIVVLNYNQSFVMKRKRVKATRDQCCNRSFEYEINENARKVYFWTGWYFTRIHDCRNPLRWIEYSFSASLMAMVFAISGGLNHIYLVLMIFGLIFSTMAFGWVSEVYNRPISRGDDIRPYYWVINDFNEHLLTFPDISARLQRLVPYFLGWVPYLFVWAPLLHSFFWNVGSAPDGAGPPDFVYAIIIGQAVLFSLFGFTQFWILVRNDGPEFYWKGEFSYLVLSLLAKGLLGSILLANVIIYETFDEAVSDAMTS